jgi:hypothetical protein
MHSGVPHIPDVFEVAMLGRNNGHNLSPIQNKEEPYQMVLPHSSAEVGGQMSLFTQEEGQDSD